MKICINSGFLQLNIPCWIRVRISNTDPDPGGDLNTDPPGSGTLQLLMCMCVLKTYCTVPTYIYNMRIVVQDVFNRGSFHQKLRVVYVQFI